MRLRERLPRVALYQFRAAAYPVVALAAVNGGWLVPLDVFPGGGGRRLPATTAGPARRRFSTQDVFSAALGLAKPGFTRIGPWYAGC